MWRNNVFVDAKGRGKMEGRRVVMTKLPLSGSNLLLCKVFDRWPRFICVVCARKNTYFRLSVEQR